MSGFVISIFIIAAVVSTAIVCVCIRCDDTSNRNIGGGIDIE